MLSQLKWLQTILSRKFSKFWKYNDEATLWHLHMQKDKLIRSKISGLYSYSFKNFNMLTPLSLWHLVLHIKNLGVESAQLFLKWSSLLLARCLINFFVLGNTFSMISLLILHFRQWIHQIASTQGIHFRIILEQSLDFMFLFQQPL